MTELEFVATVRINAHVEAILARLHRLGLNDCWLVSGALFQTVWNVLTSRPPQYGIRDYDLFYFDPDTSWEAEDRAIAHANGVFSDLDAKLELRNQARVHLWYEEKFKRPYPPLSRACEGIDRFLMFNAKVGMRMQHGSFQVYAPSGFDDIERMIVRPNRTANYNPTQFAEKAARWKTLWPELTILPA